ncbi:class II aldolase/adducin family protein [Rhizobium sp. CF080]|uniref:class II aldolase/adducin family protein n=1 Tax=Rhizobium sp. (strain CF080) TaxID=1144310 RepID=UPI000271D5BD|nr:class II aldolase/adducin family protein [Rhizobium sp. CF080]EUB99325.1 class II aldolase/adducin family protein [Rhizobium sp. CF080]
MDTTPPGSGPVSAERLADLAAASRILYDHGVVDGFGHASMRHPENPELFLMSRSLAPALVTPKDIVEYDLDSQPCSADAPRGFIERFLHGEIYRARPDVNAIVHSHSPSVIPFSLVATPMRAMFHNSAFLAEEVPVFDIAQEFGATDMLVCDCAKGQALARTLGKRNVALMRAHGSVACGPTLEIAVFRAIYTEVNARIQHWTNGLAPDGKIAALTPEEGELADEPNRTAGMRAWDLWRIEAREKYGW